MRLAILRIRKLLRGSVSKLGRRALNLGIGATLEHANSFMRGQYRTVVDIGANRGQFALFARGHFPDAKIISFEPLSECSELYERLFSGDPMATLHPLAIGPIERIENIHVTTDKDSSSLLTPGLNQTTIFGSELSGQRPVRVVRLSSAVKPAELEAPALLKIDVQGFELEVLKGCDDMLACFDDVYVEASFMELYKDQALVAEVIDFLREHGFQLRGVFNQFCDRGRGPVQADFLFRRSERL
jgi:FkbM family methyltransferase